MPQFMDWKDYLQELRRIQAELSSKDASLLVLLFLATLVTLIESGQHEEARAYYRQQPPAIFSEAESEGEEIPEPPRLDQSPAPKTKTIHYQHAEKHVRTFVVGALPHESGRFQPFFGEIGDAVLTKTGGQCVSTEERAVHLAHALLNEAMHGLKYRRVPNKGRRP